MNPSRIGNQGEGRHGMRSPHVERALHRIRHPLLCFNLACTALPASALHLARLGPVSAIAIGFLLECGRSPMPTLQCIMIPPTLDSAMAAYAITRLGCPSSQAELRWLSNSRSGLREPMPYGRLFSSLAAGKARAVSTGGFGQGARRRNYDAIDLSARLLASGRVHLLGDPLRQVCQGTKLRPAISSLRLARYVRSCRSWPPPGRSLACNRPVLQISSAP